LICADVDVATDVVTDAVTDVVKGRWRRELVALLRKLLCTMPLVYGNADNSVG
jgi:hypothetical protein